MKNLFNFSNALKSTITIAVLMIISSCTQDPESLTVNGRDLVFSFDQITVTEDVVYGIESFSHLMDIFEPPTYDIDKPVILLSHGGNFGKPSKLSELNDLAYGLARRGYVAAVVRFTQVNNEYGVYPPSDFTLDEVSFAFTRGAMDIKAAVRFFRANADTYNIDTDNIFVGGWSTGAHVSLAAATLSLEDISEISDKGLAQSYEKAIETLGGIEGNRGNAGYSSEVKGVVALMPQIVDPITLGQDDPSLFIMTDAGSYGWVNGKQISLLADIQGETLDYSYTSYGHIRIAERATEIGLDFEEHLINSGENAPNAVPLKKVYHQTIAEFLADRWNAVKSIN